MTSTPKAIDGYLELSSRYPGFYSDETMPAEYVYGNANVVGGVGALNFEKAATQPHGNRPDIGIKGYVARYVPTYGLIHGLTHTGLMRQFKRTLDIGTGYGVHPRVLRGCGIVGEAVGIDLYDRASPLDEGALRRRHNQMRRFRFLAPYTRRAQETPPNQRSPMQQAYLREISDPILFCQNHLGFADAGLYRQHFVRRPALDRMLTGNVFDLKEKFDLVTVYSAIECFDHRELLAKVAELTEEGGIAYLYWANWWSSASPYHFPGHYPWGPQRQSKDDYFAYVDKHFPNNSRHLKATYMAYDLNQPTLSDHLEAATSFGLQPVLVRSVGSSRAITHNGVTPLAWAKTDGAILAEVLSEVRARGRNVTMQDLLPFTHQVLYRKVSASHRATRQDLEALLAERQQTYRPQGLVGRLAKFAGKAVMGVRNPSKKTS